jgi:hypothetical protein
MNKRDDNHQNDPNRRERPMSASINESRRDTELVANDTAHKGIEAGKRAARTGAVSIVGVACVFATEWAIYRAIFPPPTPLAVDVAVVALPALAFLASGLSMLLGLLAIGLGHLTLRLPANRGEPQDSEGGGR